MKVEKLDLMRAYEPAKRSAEFVARMKPQSIFFSVKSKAGQITSPRCQSFDEAWSVFSTLAFSQRKSFTVSGVKM